MRTTMLLSLTLLLLGSHSALAGTPSVKRMIGAVSARKAVPYRDFDRGTNGLRKRVSGYLEVVGRQRNGMNRESVVLSHKRGKPSTMTSYSFFDNRAYVPKFSAKRVVTWPNKHLAIPVLGKKARKASDIKVTGNLKKFGLTAPIKVGDRWMRFAIIHADGMVGDQQFNNNARNTITVPHGRKTRKIEVLMGPQDL